MKRKILITTLLASIFAINGCNKTCEHSDENKDHKCDKCDSSLTECIDENKDHKCDWCGSTLSECNDEDKNHNCDICDKKLSEHSDENKDHICDLCGQQISNHIDENKDHKCDYCNATASECIDNDKNHFCDFCDKKLSEHKDDDNNGECDICGEKFTPISFKLSSDIKAEYKVGDAFVKPNTYLIYSDESPTDERKVSAEFYGYDLSKVGKQTVYVEYSDPSMSSITPEFSFKTSYDIYVFNYDQMPKGFEKAEKTVKEFFTVLYDLGFNDASNFIYDSSDKEDSLHISEMSILNDISITQAVENIVNSLNAKFISTSDLSMGRIITGETAYSINFIDKEKAFDIELLLIDRNGYIAYEAYFYKTNKLSEWPAYTMDTVISWLTPNEENIPKLEGDAYSFNAEYFNDYGIVIFDIFTQKDPTAAYESTLIKNGYKLYELPENYTFFYTNIAVTPDKEIAFEYGYENGAFYIVVFKAQSYEFESNIVAQLVDLVAPNSNTVIPTLQNAYIYRYFPEIYEYAGVTAFKAYSLQGKLDSLLNSYKQQIISKNWKILDGGKPNSEGAYSYVSPFKDIKITVRKDTEDNSIEVIIYPFIDISNGWPYEKVNTLLTSNITDEIPAFPGEFSSVTVYNDGYPSFVIGLPNNMTEQTALEEYKNALIQAGYEYSEEETKKHYNDPTYVSPNGQIILTLWTMNDGTITIDVTCALAKPAEDALEQYFRDNDSYNNFVKSFIESTKGKYIEWKCYSERIDVNYYWFYFEASIQGDVSNEVTALADGLKCVWYEEDKCWYNSETGLQISLSYDSQSNVSNICFIF